MVEPKGLDCVLLSPQYEEDEDEDDYYDGDDDALYDLPIGGGTQVQTLAVGSCLVCSMMAWLICPTAPSSSSIPDSWSAPHAAGRHIYVAAGGSNQFLSGQQLTMHPSYRSFQGSSCQTASISTDCRLQSVHCSSSASGLSTRAATHDTLP